MRKKKRSEAGSSLGILVLTISSLGDHIDVKATLTPSPVGVAKLIKLLRDARGAGAAPVASLKKLGGKACMAQTAAI